MNKVKQFSIFLVAALLCATCVLSVGFLGNRKVASAQTISELEIPQAYSLDDDTMTPPVFLGATSYNAVVAYEVRQKYELGSQFLFSRGGETVSQIVNGYRLRPGDQYIYGQHVEYPNIANGPSNSLSNMMRYTAASNVIRQVRSEWVPIKPSPYEYTLFYTYLVKTSGTIGPDNSYVIKHELGLGETIYMSFVYYNNVYDMDLLIPTNATELKDYELVIKLDCATTGECTITTVNFSVTAKEVIVSSTDKITLGGLPVNFNYIALAKETKD